MHRICMHAGTGRCMELHKPSYNVGMYGIRDREVDSTQNSNGLKPVDIFFPSEIGSRMLQIPNRKKLHTQLEFSFFFFLDRKTGLILPKLNTRVTQCKRVERAARRRTCECVELSYIFFCTHITSLCTYMVHQLCI